MYYNIYEYILSKLLDFLNYKNSSAFMHDIVEESHTKGILEVKERASSAIAQVVRQGAVLSVARSISQVFSVLLNDAPQSDSLTLHRKEDMESLECCHYRYSSSFMYRISLAELGT